ncbi:MAG: YwiC-like family protein [Candidatus Rokubacteria bacterium]|nr:YwiC-like family protein [Candidatus Rokubacteria bacterium]
MSGASRIFPREHGTWAMLLVPWIVAVGVSRRFEPAPVLVLMVALALFLAHNQLVLALRAVARRDRAAQRAAARVGTAFAAAGLLIGLAVVARVGAAVLVPSAVAAAALLAATVWLVRRRLDQTLAGQITAAVGLPVIAPVTWTVTTGALDRVAAALWLLNATFFVGAVLYVRLKIAARGRRAALVTRRDRLAFAAPTVAIDVGLLALAALAVVIGGFSASVLAAFSTVAVQTAAGIARLDRPAVLKRVGLLATAHALAFAALVVCLA